jgi:hypothetical protein
MLINSCGTQHWMSMKMRLMMGKNHLLVNNPALEVIDNPTQFEQQMHNVEWPKTTTNLATKPNSSKLACDANGTNWLLV